MIGVEIDDAGEIVAAQAFGNPDLKSKYKAFGRKFLLVRTLPGQVHEIYFDGRRFQMKQAIDAKVSKREIVADNIDLVSIEGIPAGCKIAIYNGSNTSEHVSDGSAIDFTAQSPGTYRFRVTGAAYFPFEFAVEAR